MNDDDDDDDDDQQRPGLKGMYSLSFTTLYHHFTYYQPNLRLHTYIWPLLFLPPLSHSLLQWSLLAFNASKRSLDLDAPKDQVYLQSVGANEVGR